MGRICETSKKAALPKLSTGCFRIDFIRLPARIKCNVFLSLKARGAKIRTGLTKYWGIKLLQRIKKKVKKKALTNCEGETILLHSVECCETVEEVRQKCKS